MVIINSLSLDTIRKTTSQALVTFMEKPRISVENLTQSRLQAFELFNLFTADIIKSKTVFCR